MNSELIEAIRELGETSWPDILSVAISGVSAILTIIVLWYNHRSIQLTQETIQQATNLQLYEKRMELYSGLLGDNAFEKAPLELKIIFSKKIYDLYTEIAALCEEQNNAFWEYCVSIKYMPKHDIAKYNVYDEAYKEIIANMNVAIAKFPAISEKLKTHKQKIESIHQKIVSKYEILEYEMKKTIEASIS